MSDEDQSKSPDISLNSEEIKLDTGDEHHIDTALNPSTEGKKFADMEPEFHEVGTQEEDGLKRIIKTGFVAYERMPMLENVLDRFERFWTSTLRSFTNEKVEVSLSNMTSLRFGSFMEAISQKSVFAIFKAEEWKNLGLIVVDSELAYVIVDILMGGQSGPENNISEDRQPTALERTLIDKMVTLILGDLAEAFVPVGKVTLSFERVELSGHFAVITRPLNAVIAAQFQIDINGHSGHITIVMPYVLLEPVRDKLIQQFMGEDFGGDTVWEDHLIKEILRTSVTMSAIFEETYVPLSKILSLKKGSTLKLPHKKEAPYRVRLECDGKAMFFGTLGKIKDVQAVRIDHRLIPPADKIKTVEDFGALSKSFIPR